MTLRDYASRINLSKAATDSEALFPLLLWSTSLLPRERGEQPVVIIAQAALSPLPLIADVFLVPPQCGLTVKYFLWPPTHCGTSQASGSLNCCRALGIRMPRACRDHLGFSRSEKIDQTFLRPLPNLPLKPVYIAACFSFYRLKHHYLFCP